MRMKLLHQASVFFFILPTLAVTAGSSPAGTAKQVAAPPDSPAAVRWDGTNFTLRYNHTTILAGKFSDVGTPLAFNKTSSDEDGRINQVFKWTSRDKPLKFVGTVFGSGESSPCESEPRPDAPAIVRNSVGLSRSLLNRAVYDRKSDWLVSVDFPSRVVITPASTPEGNSFHIEITGYDIMVRFRPRFYQEHRGLKYFEPWKYDVWRKPVAGWCSWFAYMDSIDETKIEKTADVLKNKLVPYGLGYLQIDDGYESEPVGTPQNWLVPNPKFPSGLEHLARYIMNDSLKPGIWTNVSFQDDGFAMSHKSLFVRDSLGSPAQGEWIGYVMDGSNPETLDTLVRPVYRGLRSMGWEYFKVDALRHLRYEGYNSYSGYFTSKGLDRAEVYRHFVESIRYEIGRNNFMLGCWGIRPELVGIIDACRVGTDGFGYGGFSEYNSFNNIVWKNDPDHIQLTPKEAYRSCMVTSLTGSLFMLTDKPDVYGTPLVEAARRSLPVMFTLPSQVYDINPSRSSRLGLVGTQLSGSGPRPFDADQKSDCDLYELEVDKPYGDWILLGRTGQREKGIRFSDLGLDPEKVYSVFEFWTKKYLGDFRNAFAFPPVDTVYNCQLFCIREKLDHPQLIATNRHITCGGYDVDSLGWKNDALSGTSRLVGGDVYEIYVREPSGYDFESATCTGAKFLGSETHDGLRIVKLESDVNATVNWTVTYRSVEGGE